MTSKTKTRHLVPTAALLLAGAAFVLGGCEGDPELPAAPEPNLTRVAPADDPASCVSCHPRQFNEWVGSSHNYGNGLDGTYQALEITANYYATHVYGVPLFRQNMLCISCHAPTAAPFNNDPESEAYGTLNSNTALREGYGAQDVGREIARPAAGTDLLPPPGRAVEMAATEGLTPEERAAQKQITFQGITCDACHKVSGPLIDSNEGSGCAEGEDPRVCAERQFEECLESDDPRCKRRSKGGHPHDEPFFDIGIANYGMIFEREGNVRYGPYAEGDVSPATAHDVSSGGTEMARNYNIAAYPDGTPFEGQDPVHLPYLQTSQFCGACHDVRLDTDNPLTDHVEVEPVNDEPFVRLENLYTEWFTSPTNLHPDLRGESDDPRLMWRDNPYRNEDGSARRVLCQDCHMSLFPYAPPGTFPGVYTNPNDCDERGECGLKAAEAGTRGNLKIANRERVSTHNMTGVDIALGQLLPVDNEIMGMGVMLPNQTSRDDLSDATVHTGAEQLDAAFELPTSLDARRVQQLENAVTLSMAGTPEYIDRSNPAGCEESGTCCNEEGVCSLPIKAWATNVNGGHNIAAGFSQERQIWIELTVQDMGRTDETGQGLLVDCTYVPKISELYKSEGVNKKGYPTRTPFSHTVDSATDLFNRMTGIDPVTGEFDHELICRGLSGHLIDKPHDETVEPVADGRLDDEDILLHRIGNTLPEYENGDEALSWHVADTGFPLDGDPTDDVLIGRPDSDVSSARVARADQFHIPGLDAFACELTSVHPNAKLADQPMILRDGSVKTISELGDLKHSVVATPDERAEILYPFPEFKPLSPHYDSEGHWHSGERFGLAYLTNIFYRVCGCAHGECEGPEEITVDGETYHAQVPWLATYPALPHLHTIDHDSPEHDNYHFAFPEEEYYGILEELGMREGTPYAEAFTFIPLNSNHMPNNRSLKFYKPQRHYWDIRVGPEVVGPIRITAKAWYRHFPPEFLRLMVRTSVSIYERAVFEDLAEDYFPHGPLVVEGPTLTEAFPQAADLDNLRRVLLDETVTYVNIGQAPEAPANPTWEDDIAPIMDMNCVPCHSDVLRHGNLILAYDDYPQWDNPAGATNPNPTQDPKLNMIDKDSLYANGMSIVVPGNPDASILWQVLTRSDDDLLKDGVYSRRMPLKTDTLSPVELATIRTWIENGAP